MKNCSLRMPSSVMAGTGSAAGLTDIINTVSARHIALFCDKGVAASGLLEAIARKIPASYDTYLDIPPEPDYHQVESLLGQVEARGTDLIVALGGGSVMDAAKLVSVLLGAEYSIRDLTGGRCESRYREQCDDSRLCHSGCRHDPSSAARNRGKHRP